ncbi:hypothetical protein ABPG74_001659 [Tetrahymena malaccensis]
MNFLIIIKIIYIFQFQNQNKINLQMNQLIKYSALLQLMRCLYKEIFQIKLLMLKSPHSLVALEANKMSMNQNPHFKRRQSIIYLFIFIINNQSQQTNNQNDIQILFPSSISKPSLIERKSERN